MELPYWPALTVLARTREVRRHRLIRSVSAVAAALLPVAGFGLLHLRGPGEVGGASAALALGGVVQPRVVQSGTDEVEPSQATPRLSPVGVTGVGARGSAMGEGGFSSQATRPRGRSHPSWQARDRRPRRETRLDHGSRSHRRTATRAWRTQALEPNVTRPDQPRSEPSRPTEPDAPKPDVPKPDKPKPAYAEAGRAEARHAEARSAEAGQAEAGQSRSRTGRSRHTEAGQAEAGQAEAGQAEAGHSRSRTSRSRTSQSRTSRSRTSRSRTSQSPRRRSRTSPRQVERRRF